MQKRDLPVLVFGILITAVAACRTPTEPPASNDATPLWVPQLAMALGTLVLFIAFVDEWVLELRGQRQHIGGSETRHE